jgi:hypothetical protein
MSKPAVKGKKKQVVFLGMSDKALASAASVSSYLDAQAADAQPPAASSSSAAAGAWCVGTTLGHTTGLAAGRRVPCDVR